MVARRGEVVAVRESEDQREVEEQQQSRDQRRHANVIDQRDSARRANATRSPREAIEQRVERQQHEVVNDSGASKPGDEVHDGAPAHDLNDRVRRHSQCPRMRKYVQQARGEVTQPRSAWRVSQSPPHTLRKVRLPIHFVQCTPGAAGTMIRAG